MERLLAGGLGTLPLAPISAVTEADLPGIIEQLKEKLGKLEQPELAGQLWTEIDVLMGLRYERELVEHLLQGVQGMEESVTYQAIVEKGVAKGLIQGRLKQAREDLLQLGEEDFGQPAPAQIQAAVEAINDIERLKKLMRHLRLVRNWEEFLADLQTSGMEADHRNGS